MLDLQKAVLDDHATWASPSTATPTACSSIDEQGRVLGGDMVTAMVGDRDAAEEASRLGDSLQPDLLPLRAGGDRARTAAARFARAWATR